MKTYRHLYPQVWDFENLYIAYHKARKKKRGKAYVAHFERSYEEELFTLQQELRQKTYQPGPYASFYVHEPKKRLISAAPFRDRVVHHALCRVIEPIWEPRFIDTSYANRVGKGTHRALDKTTEYARRYRWFLQCDVRQFFPSIDHALLRAELARLISDPDLLWLCDVILDSGTGVLSGLDTMACEPCRKGGSPLSGEEIAGLLPEIPGWEVVSEEGVARLVRTFTFADFRSALGFTLRVGELAEKEGHHPKIVTEWGRVRVEWWTHSVGGLHRNDFIMAARTDELMG